MDCSICKDLERALESRRRAYIEARAAAYYRVSTELAAKKNVDMERAKSDLEEHQLVCVALECADPLARIQYPAIFDRLRRQALTSPSPPSKSGVHSPEGKLQRARNQ